jgi:Tfp pilus assembly ATPase PilU
MSTCRSTACSTPSSSSGRQRPSPDRGPAADRSACTATCGTSRPRSSIRRHGVADEVHHPERNQQELQEGGTDFGFAYGDEARFRVSVFRQRGDIAMVLRQIPNKLLTFEQIGLPEICKELIRRPRGLFLVTGPTGSGKTTSLATMIDYINRTSTGTSSRWKTRSSTTTTTRSRS